ncbi:MAG: DEAD/DEAH box helicase [Cytophagales bacterium]|nr:DEAD/DEAH box helicase [Cytophagales bacterium]
MSFKRFNLSEPILKALHEKGYHQPTPVQKEAIPQIISRKDIIGSAQTGTGKTAAFCIPILQLLQQGRRRRGIKALILTPTRELAAQVCDNLNFYGKYLPLRNTQIFGGVSQNAQVQQIRQGVDILVATPGRLLDLMGQGIINLKSLEILVLDEADRMLDMGFIHDIKKVIAASPAKRQDIFFSATMPKGVQKLVMSIMRNPVKVHVEGTSDAKADIHQFVYHVEKRSKHALLKHIISEKEMKNVLVFSRTKHGANRIAKNLNRSGIKAEAIHGDKSQHARQRALHNFKMNSTRVLVATDIAARGIDINNLPYVINFELPETPETYTHRIGRTGRAGATGSAFSLCDVSERGYLKRINRRTSRKLATVEHPFCQRITADKQLPVQKSNR